MLLSATMLVLAAIAGSTLGHWWWAQLTEQHVLTEQLRVGREVAVLTAGWLDQSLAPIEAVAANDHARRLDAAPLSELAQHLQTLAPHVAAVVIADDQHRPVVVTGGQPPAPSDSAALPQRSIVALGPAVRQGRGVTHAQASVPILDNQGQSVGTVSTFIDLGGLRALIRTLPLTDNQLGIFDAEGYPVANHGIDTSRAPVPGDDVRQRLRSHPFLASVLAGQEVQDGNYPDTISGRPRSGVAVPVPRHGWAVIVTQPRAVSQAIVWRSYGVSLVLIALLTLAGAGVWRWYTHRVRRPLLALEQRMLAVAGGHPSPPAHVRPGDEAGCLALALDHLMAAAAERETRLDGARAQLALQLQLNRPLIEHTTVGLALIDWPSQLVLAANPAFYARHPGVRERGILGQLPGAGDDIVAYLAGVAEGRPAAAIAIESPTGRERWRAFRLSSSPPVRLLLQIEPSE